MSELKLHNTLTGGKVSFVPLDPSHVRVYACGPTVYSYAHIGNARMAVVFDLLVRVLRTLYPKVTYVSNITDVDDKIMAAAVETGQKINDITTKYARIYNEDMAALGVHTPDVQPRATDHIGEMIALIARLIEQGHAYAAAGHVMFHVPSFPAYGRLSGRSRDDQIAGARVEIAPYKKDAADFILWKPSTDDQPGWDSPWGRGRPGWHIECSAMAEKHLGLPFDIHGGGADLKFPHHENEIAQSCCAHGHDNDPAAFARYWVHNGFVTVEGEKMAKSVGNIRLTHELLAAHQGEVLRLTLLSAHYRQPLDWTLAAIGQAQQFLDRIYRILKDIEHLPVPDDASPPDEVMAALCDDLNTPKAMAALSVLARDLVAADNDDSRTALKGRLLAAGRLVGILQVAPDVWLGYGQTALDDNDMAPADIENLLRERDQARKSRDFARADEIRDLLAAHNIMIEDTPAGAQWRRKS